MRPTHAPLSPPDTVTAQCNSALGIQKLQAVLSLLEITRSGRTEAFLATNGDTITQITGSQPEADKQVIWRLPGKGWAGSTEGWPTFLTTLETLTATLLPLLTDVGEEIAKARIADLESRTIEVTIDLSVGQPPAVEKKSLWDRLRGKK